MLLQVSNLVKDFGGLRAVDNLNLVVGEKGIVGIIGPNGAGKTTAFNLIAGRYAPTSGKIIFEGQEIQGLKPYEVCRRGIARTFQVAQPLRDMTVLDNVVTAALVRTNSLESAAQRALPILEFVGLGGRQQTRAKDLNTIDQRRLELARTWATQPKLLLLDEVMAGLNPKECDEAIALVRNIREQGVTVVIVEHVMRAVMSLSDRIVVMCQGTKIAEGAPREVANNPKVIEAYLGEEFRHAENQ